MGFLFLYFFSICPWLISLPEHETQTPDLTYRLIHHKMARVLKVESHLNVFADDEIAPRLPTLF